jgi:hypothetical protein
VSDRATDFSKFKTYEWAPGHKALDPGWDRAIVDAIDKALAAQGLKKGAPADVLVEYHAVQSEEVDLRTFDDKAPAQGQERASAQLVKKGTLAIDMREPASRKVIWRVAAEQAITQMAGATASATCRPTAAGPCRPSCGHPEASCRARYHDIRGPSYDVTDAAGKHYTGQANGQFLPFVIGIRFQAVSPRPRRGNPAVSSDRRALGPGGVPAVIAPAACVPRNGHTWRGRASSSRSRSPASPCLRLRRTPATTTPSC